MDDICTYFMEKEVQIDTWISEPALISTQMEKEKDDVNVIPAQVSSLRQRLDDLKNIFSDAHSFNATGMGRLRDITEKSWSSIEEKCQKIDFGL